MTVLEAVQQTQRRGPGLINGGSVRYAQSLLEAGEAVLAAMTANLTVRRESFPGVVVLTDRRVFAVCGLPGIRRTVSCDWDRLDTCEEKPTALRYAAAFAAGEARFSLTADPETGERFSRAVAARKGEAAEFDAAGAGEDSGIWNPTLVRNRRRAQKAREKDRAVREAERERVRRERAEAAQNTPTAEADPNGGADAQETAERLAAQLAAARAREAVPDTDPRAVAARLAAELADAERNPLS